MKRLTSICAGLVVATLFLLTASSYARDRSSPPTYSRPAIEQKADIITVSCDVRAIAAVEHRNRDVTARCTHQALIDSRRNFALLNRYWINARRHPYLTVNGFSTRTDKTFIRAVHYRRINV